MTTILAAALWLVSATPAVAEPPQATGGNWVEQAKPEAKTDVAADTGIPDEMTNVPGLGEPVTAFERAERSGRRCQAPGVAPACDQGQRSVWDKWLCCHRCESALAEPHGRRSGVPAVCAKGVAQSGGDA